MRVIALTGGIGSGKSSVTAIFASLGIATLSADELARADQRRPENQGGIFFERFGSNPAF